MTAAFLFSLSGVRYFVGMDMDTVCRPPSTDHDATIIINARSLSTAL
jgi:hypothetical protein